MYQNLGLDVLESKSGWREGDTRPGPSSMSIQSRNCLRAMNTLQVLHETKCFLKRPKGHLNHQLSWLLSRDIKPYFTYFVLPIIQGWKVHCFQNVKLRNELCKNEKEQSSAAFAGLHDGDHIENQWLCYRWRWWWWWYLYWRTISEYVIDGQAWNHIR